jgi:transcriptional regulator with XRE-family HTH domain
MNIFSTGDTMTTDITLLNRTFSQELNAHQEKSLASNPATIRHLADPLLVNQPYTLPINADPKSTPQARGKRLRTARMMTGLTRKAMEKKYGVSASTIQAWEDAKASGLTERGVIRVLPVLHKEGIACKAEWLLYGIGLGPQQNNQPLPVVSQEEIERGLSAKKLLTQELLVFRTLHPGASDLVVFDDGMGPKFCEGDYVAGIYRSGDAIESTVGLDCIVQTSNGNTLFRRVKKSNKPGLYNLVCINLDTAITDIALYDQTLINAAPVIWHRRCIS